MLNIPVTYGLAIRIVNDLPARPIVRLVIVSAYEKIESLQHIRCAESNLIFRLMYEIAEITGLLAAALFRVKSDPDIKCREVRAIPVFHADTGASIVERKKAGCFR